MCLQQKHNSWSFLFLVMWKFVEDPIFQLLFVWSRGSDYKLCTRVGLTSDIGKLSRHVFNMLCRGRGGNDWEVSKVDKRWQHNLWCGLLMQSLSPPASPLPSSRLFLILRSAWPPSRLRRGRARSYRPRLSASRRSCPPPWPRRSRPPLSDRSSHRSSPRLKLIRSKTCETLGSVNELKLACLSWVSWRECRVNHICSESLYIGCKNFMSTLSA